MQIHVKYPCDVIAVATNFASSTDTHYFIVLSFLYLPYYRRPHKPSPWIDSCMRAIYGNLVSDEKNVPPSTSSLLFLLVVKASRHMKKLIRRARVKKMIREFPFDFFGIFPQLVHLAYREDTLYTSLYGHLRVTMKSTHANNMMTRRARSVASIHT